MDFFQTVMGNQFYNSTMPRIVTALERIADRLATAEQCSATLEQFAGPVDATDDRVTGPEVTPTECLDDEQPPCGDERDHAAILNVRRGLKRGAELVRALDNAQIVPGIHRRQQQEILEYAAAFLEKQSRTYGSPTDNDQRAE